MNWYGRPKIDPKFLNTRFVKNFFFSEHIMMKSSRVEEDRNIEEKIIYILLKKLKEETDGAAIKGIRNQKQGIHDIFIKTN